MSASVWFPMSALQDRPPSSHRARHCYMVKAHLLERCILSLEELYYVWSWNANIKWGILHAPLEADARQLAVKPEINTHAQKSGGTVPKPLLPLPRWLTISRTHGARWGSTLPLPHSLKPSGFNSPMLFMLTDAVMPLLTSQVFLFPVIVVVWGERGEEGMRQSRHKVLCFLPFNNQLWLPQTTLI